VGEARSIPESEPLGSKLEGINGVNKDLI